MKKIAKTHAALVAAVGLIIGTGQTFAASIDITRPDFAGPPTYTPNGFNNGPFVWNGNNAAEDNETERTSIQAIPSQAWDMEAITYNDVTKKLYLVAGYNMSTGQDGWKPGDLFIKVGGNAGGPGTGPTSGGDVLNNQFPAGEGYTYAIDLSLIGGLGSSTSRYTLGGSTLLNTVNWDSFNSNPWKVADGASVAATNGVAISYTTNQTAAQVAAITGVANLAKLQDNTSTVQSGPTAGFAANTGQTHNILEIDMNWFSVASGTQVYFSYVMECGNDSLKGQYGNGFDINVPDGGISVIMLGMGLASLGLLSLRRRTS